MLKEIVAKRELSLKDMKPLGFERLRPLISPKNILERLNFICEIKKSSPSKGDINLNIDIVKQAQDYKKYGAGAISVLVEPHYFNGSYRDLKVVADQVDLPILAKDFIISDIQIENSYRAGADIILLIVSSLSKKQLFKLSEKGNSLGLSILYEIHSLDQFQLIKDLNPKFVGVNSRNLFTMEVDKRRGAGVISRLEGDFLKVAESGIRSKEDIEIFSSSGADAFLIGSSLMESRDLEHTFTQLREGLNVC